MRPWALCPILFTIFETRVEFRSVLRAFLPTFLDVLSGYRGNPSRGAKSEDLASGELAQVLNKGETQRKRILSFFSDPAVLGKTFVSPGSYNDFHKAVGPKQNLFKLQLHLP